MKMITKSAMLTLAALGFAACGGGANTATNGNANAVRPNSNTAVVVNTNSVMNSNAVNSTTNTTSNSANVSSADKEFMNKAAQGGMTEVMLGELASTKAQNADVKKFAQQMVTDHTKANTELKTIAAGKSVTLPTEVNAEQKAMHDKLSKLSGAEFDKEYVKGMVEDHEKTVADFEKESSGGADADAKGFATKNLPTIKGHLEMIKGISAKMK